MSRNNNSSEGVIGCLVIVLTAILLLPVAGIFIIDKGIKAKDEGAIILGAVMFIVESFLPV